MLTRTVGSLQNLCRTRWHVQLHYYCHAAESKFASNQKLISITPECILSSHSSFSESASNFFSFHHLRAHTTVSYEQNASMTAGQGRAGQRGCAANLLQLQPGSMQQAVHDKLVQGVDKVAELVCQHIAMLQRAACRPSTSLHPGPFQAPLCPSDLRGRRRFAASHVPMYACLMSEGFRSATQMKC